MSGGPRTRSSSSEDDDFDHNNTHHFQNKDTDVDQVHYDVAAHVNLDIILGHDLSFNGMNSYNTNNSSMSMMTTTTTSHGGGGGGGGGGVSEITEVIEEVVEKVMASTSSNDNNNAISSVNRGQLMPIISDMNKGGLSDRHDDVVYVAVGKSETSMDALVWTLDHVVIPATTSLVYLIHIFPELKFIPSPLGGGRVPKSQVSPELAETYLAQERSKTRELLHKYMDKCNAHLVQVETILIESDSVGNAIAELISILDITKLVVGISKSNLRKLTKGGKGSGIVADEILQSAPLRCEVKIICQGKDVSPLTLARTPTTTEFKSPAVMTKATVSTTPSATTKVTVSTDSEDYKHPNADNSSFSCCFRPTF